MPKPKVIDNEEFNRIVRDFRKVYNPIIPNRDPNEILNIFIRTVRRAMKPTGNAAELIAQYESQRKSQE